MFEHHYLPAVDPIGPEQPNNLTQNTAGKPNEPGKVHICVERPFDWRSVLGV